MAVYPMLSIDGKRQEKRREEEQKDFWLCPLIILSKDIAYVYLYRSKMKIVKIKLFSLLLSKRNYYSVYGEVIHIYTVLYFQIFLPHTFNLKKLKKAKKQGKSMFLFFLIILFVTHHSIQRLYFNT